MTSLQPQYLLADELCGSMIQSSSETGSGGEYTRCIRPIRAGYSFGLRSRVGTLGAVVYDEDTDEQLLLASSHVLNRRPNGQVYDIYQPAGRDRLTRTDAPIAVAMRYTRLSYQHANTTEAGLARPFPDTPVDPTHPLGSIQGIATQLEVGSRVHKVSRSTGYTQGVVKSIDFSGSIRLGGRRYLFIHQVLISGNGNPISLEGDSGAMWITEDGYAAALNFAGSHTGQLAIASPMHLVAKRLRIRITSKT